MPFAFSRLLELLGGFFEPRAPHPPAKIDSIEPRQLLSAMIGPLLPTRAAPALPHYDHIVIVMEENHSYNQILGTPVFRRWRFRRRCGPT
jgi:hypothetical protein